MLMHTDEYSPKEKGATRRGKQFQCQSTITNVKYNITCSK